MATDYSDYEFLKIEVKDRVATVTLNRPPHNAIHAPLHHELEQVWLDLAGDPAVHAILLTSACEVFSIGGDMMGAVASGDVWNPTGKGQGRGSITQANGRRLVENMLDVEQPIIAAVTGDALAFASNMVLLSDITVVSETAKIADTHVRYGIVAGDGGAVIWPLVMGPHRAKEYLMRGCSITGAEAGRIGMVNYALPADQVMTKARELAQELADGPTWAIRYTKLAVNKWLKEHANLIFDASVAYEMMTFKTEDHKEAMKALAENRKPNYSWKSYMESE